MSVLYISLVEFMTALFFRKGF